MKIKTEIDDYEIIDSGTLVFKADSIVKFNFSDANLNLNFRIKFTENAEIDHSKFDTTVNEEENYLEINIINSNGSLNMGNIGLASLAKIDNRQLYLKFRFSSVDEDEVDKIFHYTWYLKNK
ncbi:DUF6864 domain-containing function [Flavobacterium sp.]|jgi:hypothetical protein|uniref:DUF6864 domain-containing function n=1 Tax=Flavobacterium sp. TaxID=239 RepID=UPI0037C0896A